jgi:hypothetical protein
VYVHHGCGGADGPAEAVPILPAAPVAGKCRCPTGRRSAAVASIPGKAARR